MVRTQIHLTDEQWRRLRIWSKLEKTSASALIRTAIQEHYVKRPTPAEYLSVLDQAFRSWRGRKKSSLELIRQLRLGKRLKQFAS